MEDTQARASREKISNKSKIWREGHTSSSCLGMIWQCSRMDVKVLLHPQHALFPWFFSIRLFAAISNSLDVEGREGFDRDIWHDADSSGATVGVGRCARSRAILRPKGDDDIMPEIGIVEDSIE